MKAVKLVSATAVQKAGLMVPSRAEWKVVRKVAAMDFESAARKVALMVAMRVSLLAMESVAVMVAKSVFVKAATTGFVMVGTRVSS